jgi:CheY-like chemotaxis protein
MDAVRVLVVDDNSDTTDSLGLLLRLWGHKPLAARGGTEALAAASDFQPDVALLDIGMPRMDGFELARRLRDLPGLGDLTLLAMTGYADADYRRRTEEAGFLAHLAKPADPAELEALLGVLAREKAQHACAT